MKRVLTFMGGFLITLYGVAQTDPKSEEDFKKLILSHPENYDPIVGIFLPKGYSLKYLNGQLQKTQELPTPVSKCVIVRKGSCFVALGLPITTSTNLSTFNCTFTATSNPGTYYFGDQKVQINSEGNIEWTNEIPIDDLAKHYKTSVSDLMKLGYKEITKNEWVKIFPTKWDIDQAIKEFDKEKESGPSTGTGFALTNSGLIVTNYHVIEGAKSIIIKGVNKNFNISYKATIVVSDARNDLAILMIDDPRFTGFQALPYLIRNGPVDVGESIFVLGYPLTASMGEEVKLTNGIISSKTGFEGDISMYQISAPVQPGNSGAPLFDSQGNIIGIVSAKHTQAENVGYAIKANYLQNLFDIMSSPPKLPIANTISTKSLPEKVKILSNFVFIVSVNEN